MAAIIAHLPAASMNVQYIKKSIKNKKLQQFSRISSSIRCVWAASPWTMSPCRSDYTHTYTHTHTPTHTQTHTKTHTQNTHTYTHTQHTHTHTHIHDARALSLCAGAGHGKEDVARLRAVTCIGAGPGRFARRVVGCAAVEDVRDHRAL